MDQLNGHSEVPVSLLPQRNPGASGISGSPVRRDELERPDPRPMPEDRARARRRAGAPNSRRQAPVDTSAFFASRAQASTNGIHGDHETGAHER